MSGQQPPAAAQVEGAPVTDATAVEVAVGNVVVVGPHDAVPIEQVKDGAGGGIIDDAGDLVVHEPVGRGGHEKAAVGEGRPEARREPPVGQREGPGQAGVKRQVLFGPVAHRGGGVGVGGELLDGCHEAVVGAVPVLQVGGRPALRGYASGLLGAGEMEGCDDLAGGGPVAGRRVRQSVAAAEGPEVVVKGVVLHH